MKNLILVCGLLLSLNSFAGNERGNGGNAVVCRNADDSIKSAELLDIYEGKALAGLEYDELTDSIDDKYKMILTDIFGSAEDFSVIRLLQLNKSFKMLPAGVALEDINDSYHVLIPRGCKIEQVANFYNPKNIYIVSDIYNKFSDLDKLGLLLHEALYLEDREGGISNSRYVRRAVAKLLSRDFRAEAVKGGVDIQSVYKCGTSSQLGSNNSTSFYAFKNERQKWTLQFTRLNGHAIFSKKTVEMNFQDGLFPLMRGQEYDFRGSHFYVATMDSLIDGDEALMIGISNGVIHMPYDSFTMGLKWMGFDPDDKIEAAPFTCAL